MRARAPETIDGNEVESEGERGREDKENVTREFYIILFITKCNESRTRCGDQDVKTSGKDNSCVFFLLLL